MSEQSDALVQFFKALADESRLRIVGILAQGERTVEELAAMLRLRTPTVSHHLVRLRQIGLVDMQPEGNTHLYRLNARALERMSKALLAPATVASFAADVDTGAWERKVLGDFFQNGRLKEIPASRKKRLVILMWLAERFEPGARYSEAEVNEVLKRYHPDFATLRRELIMNRLMARERGVYWRLPGEAPVTRVSSSRG